jgi:hypothetical protein
MAGLAGLCLTASLAALVALNSGGALRLGSAELAPIAAGYDRLAEARLAGAAPPSPAARAESAALSRGAVAQFPYDTGAWLRLAYLDRLEHGRLTPQGLAALRRSYDLVAVDPDFGVWRISFALENSQSLPPLLRAAVREEVSALWTVQRDRGRLLNLRTQLQNPAGRLSLLLWINRLQADRAK